MLCYPITNCIAYKFKKLFDNLSNLIWMKQKLLDSLKFYTNWAVDRSTIKLGNFEKRICNIHARYSHISMPNGIWLKYVHGMLNMMVGVHGDHIC